MNKIENKNNYFYKYFKNRKYGIIARNVPVLVINTVFIEVRSV